MPCPCQCGGHTVWDDEVGSSICTTCGSLADPTQSVLTSHDHHDSTSNIFPLNNYRARGHTWALQGQSKSDRDARLAYQSHAFIRALASSLAVPGLSPRSINLFTQAMPAGNFRWGRKANLVAGVCLAIALRESRRPDSLRDIAALINEPPTLLSRLFPSVLALLSIKLSPADPAIYITTLQDNLASILQDSSPTLPMALINKLRSLSLHPVMQSLRSLADLLFRLGEHNEITSLPVAPTACALLILALEAEARSSLSNVGDLAERLGSFHRVAKGVVMSRYKLIQDIIANWINEVPWLDKYINVKGRAKIAKRTIVAKGIKDVIRYRTELWNQELESIRQAKPQFDNDSNIRDETELAASSSSVDAAPASEIKHHPRKKRKTLSALDRASQFLLNPLAFPFEASKFPNTTPNRAQSVSEFSDDQAQSSSSSSTCLPLMNYLLSSADLTTGLQHAPSRLQLLCADRHGEAGVRDDELLAESEWEGMLRTEEEQRQLQSLWDREAIFSGEHRADESAPRTSSKKRKFASHGETQAQQKASGSRRINMEAFARLMASTNTDEDDLTFPDPVSFDEDSVHDDVDILDDDGDDEDLLHQVLSGTGANISDGDGVLVDEWRPPSPTGGGAFEMGYEEHPS